MTHKREDITVTNQTKQLCWERHLPPSGPSDWPWIWVRNGAEGFKSAAAAKDAKKVKRLDDGCAGK